jgi:DNA-binding cell septation regulator SpoVG
MKIENYTQVNNPKFPALIAEFTLETEKFIIHGCRVLRGKNGWFASVPSVRIGEQWISCIRFKQPHHQKAFDEGMKQAVQKYVNNPPSQDSEEFTSEIPF